MRHTHLVSLAGGVATISIADARLRDELEYQHAAALRLALGASVGEKSMRPYFSSLAM